ncbi:MAG: hypothetical protein B6I24_02145 [Bacteroidetes bacterium 4572_128]|nr:MAG: hypothetical protein B6I24_02145 [Bacteroidetes bacterium 4572_128]
MSRKKYISAKEKISEIVQRWYITEPLLFIVWITHRMISKSNLKTIRTLNSKIEYNNEFINSLTESELSDVLTTEVMRILLKHPYSRQKENKKAVYLASNITIKEYNKDLKKLKTAEEFFGTYEFNRKYFEFYYDKIIEKFAKDIQKYESDEEENNSKLKNGNSNESDEEKNSNENDEEENSDNNKEKDSNVEMNNDDIYFDYEEVGYENTFGWSPNEFISNQIDQRIETAIQNNSWGSISGNLKEQIIASLKPKINYRTVLKAFMSSILSSNRKLTRMKPSRRYGFKYMGSRRTFSTKLLVAVDVSGSVSSKDLNKAFSIINRFFKYGIEVIDVIQFDTEIKGKTMTLKKAIKKVQIKGRGGTDFNPVMKYIDKNKSYDGLIIFTDGYSFTPKRPKNRKTRILWLYDSKYSYKQNYNDNEEIKKIGKSIFIEE